MTELRAFLDVRRTVHGLKCQAVGKIVCTFVAEVASYIEASELGSTCVGIQCCHIDASRFVRHKSSDLEQSPSHHKTLHSIIAWPEAHFPCLQLQHKMTSGGQLIRHLEELLL